MEKPTRSLECACCAGLTRGRQWWNQDTGYGICSACIVWMRKSDANGKPRETEAQIADYYGIEGTHFNVSEAVKILNNKMGIP